MSYRHAILAIAVMMVVMVEIVVVVIMEKRTVMAKTPQMTMIAILTTITRMTVL